MELSLAGLRMTLRVADRYGGRDDAALLQRAGIDYLRAEDLLQGSFVSGE